MQNTITTTFTFAYDMDCKKHGIACDFREQERWSVEYYAKNGRAAGLRAFAASLLRQQGRWSEKQRVYAAKMYRNANHAFHLHLAESCYNASVEKFIAQVGRDAALAHAKSLAERADAIERGVYEAQDRADSFDRYSASVHNSRLNGAASLRERATRIARIAG